MTTAKDVAIAATTDLFGKKDPSAVDRWVSPDYVQHGALAGDGPAAMRELVASLGPDFDYKPTRVLADGNLVAFHGVYRGLAETPLVGFDIFRVEGDKLVEHWDALTPVVTHTASGRTQTDGPSEITEPAKTAANRTLVKDFAERVLQGADYSALPEYISTDTYYQHNVEAADGLDGFGAAATAWAEQGKSLNYQTVHNVIADGEFVLVQSEGEFGVPVGYYDLFRVADGKIVEHWDVVAEIPADIPHDNGFF